ncbi:MAG: hypothetical protein DDT38_00350 [Firmicutes bacterium]|nr:hypothetical protein [candidate division NPL-UPA2 bacterium]
MAVPVTIDALHRPVAGEIVKQYGFRWLATHQDFRYHLGIGLAAMPGSPVVAAYAGRVKSIETNHPEWGTRVVVEHGGGWRTEYANIASVAVRGSKRDGAFCFTSFGTIAASLGRAPKHGS